MEVKAKLQNHANATTTAQITGEELDKKVENLAQKASKNIKMDGFRRGKVPVSAVKKRYGKELQNDARNELFKELIDEALRVVGKVPNDILGEPIIKKFDEKDGNISVEMEISFRPDIKVDGYEEIVPEFSTPKVTKKEIDEKINEILTQIAPLEKIDKDMLEDGDWAKFDFEGFIDGVAFEGGKANDYILQIGSNQFIPGFEAGMVGMKIGETKDIKVTFPKDYNAQNLAGKDAIFKVTLHEIQGKKIGSLDDETLKKLMPNEKEPTAENFEAKIKSQIKNEKLINLINEDLKHKFAESAVAKFTFDLPNNIVEQEMDLQFRNAWNDFSEDERKKFSENKDELLKQRESYRDEAIKSVRLTFIIDEIAKKRDIKVSDTELIQAVYFEAYRFGVEPKQHLENYKNQGILPALKMAMVEDKLFRDLFDIESKESKKSTKKEKQEDKQ